MFSLYIYIPVSLLHIDACVYPPHLLVVNVPHMLIGWYPHYPHFVLPIIPILVSPLPPMLITHYPHYPHVTTRTGRGAVEVSGAQVRPTGGSTDRGEIPPSTK